MGWHGEGPITFSLMVTRDKYAFQGPMRTQSLGLGHRPPWDSPAVVPPFLPQDHSGHYLYV